MHRLILPIVALLLATAILDMGNGLQGTLLSVRGELEGFPVILIGFLMSAYFMGFIFGCRTIPALVGAVGHIRTFTALASVASAAALVHALVLEPITWVVLRGVTGFCFAGLAMIIESWINERATNETRGQILSIYRITDFAALTTGQMLLTLADPQEFTLFAIASIFVSLALVPVALTRAPAPQPIERSDFKLSTLFVVSPLAFVGATTAGVATTAFWALGPVFAQRAGFGTDLVAAFMSVTIIGGAVSQWPVGYLSDKIDRRKVIIAISLLAGVAGFFMWRIGSNSENLTLAGGLLFGMFAMPLFGLSAAHANDYAEPDTYVAVNSGLLFLYGVGAVIGPLVAAPVMDYVGGNGLFLCTMVLHGALAVFGLLRLMARDGVIAEDKENYLPQAVGAMMPTSTPEAYALDPRLEDDDLENQIALEVAPEAHDQSADDRDI